MTDAEIKNILYEINRMEEYIDTYKKCAKNAIDSAENWNGAETAATYAARLNGYISERRGMFTILNLLNFKMNFKNDKLISLEPPKEDE